jgi:hypothetical protein
MELARPHKDCVVVRESGFVKAVVGPGSATEALDCYRTLIELTVRHKFERALVIGHADDDPLHHLAARDGIIALHEIGVPAGFKIAFVPRTAETLNGYRHAELEARERGIRARVFHDDQEAIRWLTEPDLH